MTKEEKLNDEDLKRLEVAIADLKYCLRRCARNSENTCERFREQLFVAGFLANEFEKRLDDFLYGD